MYSIWSMNDQHLLSVNVYLKLISHQPLGYRAQTQICIGNIHISISSYRNSNATESFMLTLKVRYYFNKLMCLEHSLNNTSLYGMLWSFSNMISWSCIWSALIGVYIHHHDLPRRKQLWYNCFFKWHWSQMFNNYLTQHFVRLWHISSKFSNITELVFYLMFPFFLVFSLIDFMVTFSICLWHDLKCWSFYFFLFFIYFCNTYHIHQIYFR